MKSKRLLDTNAPCETYRKLELGHRRVAKFPAQLQHKAADYMHLQQQPKSSSVYIFRPEKSTRK